MNYMPSDAGHDVRIHSAFREHQKAVNAAWAGYYEAAASHGIDSGEARAAELHLRQVRWQLRRFIQRPRANL